MADNPTIVLTIEDDPGAVRLLQEMLHQTGPRLYRLEWRKRLASGLERLAAGGVDLVLLDLNLPDSEGLQTYKRVRQVLPGLPIIILSNQDDQDLALEAIAHGAQDYLVKRFLNYHFLGRALHYALERHHLMTKQKLYELQQTEFRLRQVLENNYDAMLVIGRDGLVRYANSATERLWGKNKDALLGEPFGFPIEAGRPSEIELVSDGHVRAIVEMHVTETDWNEETAYLASLRDITQRRRAEEALREAERAMSTLVSNLPGMVYRCHNNPDWTMEFVSEGCQDLLGYSPADLMEQRVSFRELIHPWDRGVVWEATQAAVRQKRSFKLLYRIKPAAGPYKWVMEQGTPVCDNDHRLTVLEGFITDVTDRKEADDLQRLIATVSQLLSESQTLGIASSGLLQAFCEHLHFQFGALWTVTPGRAELRCQMLWHGPEVNAPEFTAATLATAIAPGRGVPGRVLASGEAVWVAEVHTDESCPRAPLAGRAVLRGSAGFPILGKDGVVGVLEFLGYEVEAPGQALRQTMASLGAQIGQSMERRRLEEELQQSQKMEAIGRLTGGIAHDFNNMLTAINGYSDLLLSALDEEDPSYHALEQIQYAGERAGALTRQLLAFSRKQVLAPQVLDLNALVTNMEKLLRRLIGEDIRLITEQDPSLGSVRADPGQLEQVVMNLAVNARDAMPNGGGLIIKTRNAELDESFVHLHAPAVPGAYVMLSMTDTGCGMEKETQERVFEPFFTTKGEGKGTGLGLSTVYGIVKQSGGFISLDSKVGKGTTIEVYLPRVAEAPTQAPKDDASLEHLRGSEIILLVEDETVVRDLARSLLEASGYTVLQADNGRQALEIAGTHRGPIDLLLTDTVMPGMNGRQVAEHLLAMRPTLKVLFMSGYTDKAILPHGLLEPATAFLQKPFKGRALLAKVREVLEDRVGNASPPHEGPGREERREEGA